MIISEKQIVALMNYFKDYLAYLDDPNEDEYNQNAFKLYEEIIDQQSNELKVISNED